ncbi:MAG: sulfite exporter TauE/SafE family protein [Blautia sp.]|nr:sulfite exporter TauE/SafE family protein [Blautia sp.]
MSKTIHLNIGGMTCINCQNKIEKGLSSTDGVIRAKVSYNDGTADIEYEEEKITQKGIFSVIEDLDYEVLLQKKYSASDLIDTISILIIIVALYVILQNLGILNRLVPGQLAESGMSLGMLFVIGLITSVHCIAMCGGINLSQCIPRNAEAPSAEKRSQPILPSLYYNLGRVCSYTAVGFLLGLAGLLAGGGGEVGLSAFLQGILKIIAGLFMVVMGINMLGIFPWLRKFTIRTPRFLARRIGAKRATASRPFIVGLLNGFMPCGPLQSMWIVALASGNPFTGALSMFLFSLGTVPLMLGLGSIVSLVGKKFTDTVMKVGAVLVVVLGLAMLSQGGLLSGLLSPELLLVLIIVCFLAGVLLSIPVQKKALRYAAYAASLLLVAGSYSVWNVSGMAERKATASENTVELVNGVQEVHSTLEPGHYPSITVQAGIPVRWTIDAPDGSINGCNYRMLIREYGTEYTFQPGENVLEFTPLNTGTVSYNCWMGMIQGTIYVTEGNGEELAIPTEYDSDQIQRSPLSGMSCCG